MLKELLSIFRGDNPFKKVSEDFNRMLAIAEENVRDAGRAFWERTGDVATVRRKDVEVNQLERSIRKRIATHLAVATAMDVPYSLMMMSLVKDVERIGDYAKNLADLANLVPDDFPADPLVNELREIRKAVETLASEAGLVFHRSDTARAAALTREGRTIEKKCDELVRRAAQSSLGEATAVTIAVGARFYKRISAHYLNLVSAVIMPLHKLDFFDEDVLAKPDDE